MSEHVGAERPYDPEGAQEIWRRARKKYSNRNEIVSYEQGEHPFSYEARYNDFINREAISIAIDVLGKNGKLPNQDTISSLLRLHPTTLNTILQNNFSLIRKQIDVILRLGKLSVLESTARLLDEHRDITLRSIAKDMDCSVSYVEHLLRDHPEAREIFDAISGFKSRATEAAYRSAARRLEEHGLPVTLPGLASETGKTYKEVWNFFRRNLQLRNELHVVGKNARILKK